MSDFSGKNVQNSISAGAPPQTPYGELTALSRPPDCILGALLLRGGERKGREGKPRRKGGSKKEGVWAPYVYHRSTPLTVLCKQDCFN